MVCANDSSLYDWHSVFPLKTTHLAVNVPECFHWARWRLLIRCASLTEGYCNYDIPVLSLLYWGLSRFAEVQDLFHYCRYIRCDRYLFLCSLLGFLRAWWYFGSLYCLHVLNNLLVGWKPLPYFCVDAYQNLLPAKSCHRSVHARHQSGFVADYNNLRS